MQLTAHFTREELACRCGCGIEQRPEYQDNLKATALMLEDVRHTNGDNPVTVDCGIRCEAHNKAVGGQPDSQHLIGKAADIKIPGRTPDQVADACEHIPSVNGIGRYNTFTHVDHRGYKARWDLRTN